MFRNVIGDGPDTGDFVIAAIAASIEIENSSFPNQFKPVFGDRGSTIAVLNSTFLNGGIGPSNLSMGVHMYCGAICAEESSLFLVNDTFDGGGPEGVYSDRSSLTLRASRFSRTFGQAIAIDTKVVGSCGAVIDVENDTFENIGTLQDPGGCGADGAISITPFPSPNGSPLRLGEITIRNDRFVNDTCGLTLSGDLRSIIFDRLTFRDNGIGIGSEGATLYVTNSTFKNREYDLELVSNDHVFLRNSSFDPAKVYIEQSGELVSDSGTIRNVTLAVLLGGLAATVTSVLFESGRWKLWAAGFSRFGRSRSLENERREALFGAVQSKPGISLVDLEAMAGSRGAAAYHLRKLVRDGYVKSVRDGTRMRFFPQGAVAHANELSELARRMVSLSEASPGIGIKEASRQLGCSKQLASYHAHALAEKGIIQIRDKARGGVGLFPADVPPRA
ncbi:MAG: hypothetical protein ACYDDF_15160 [Thermoplasmatota archaeon]